MRTEDIVLIAGGAGSIGGALAERLVCAGSEGVILVDKNENGLENLRLRLADKGFNNLTMYVGDIRNLYQLNRIFAKHEPDTILNCAAHKHVVSGEKNIAETTRNNLLTTYNLLKVRLKNPDSKFVLISTDKAVEPTSVMGASKMLCESMVREEYPKTKDRNYIIRFGNVANTQGSVLEIWDRQFKEGYPLTITDLKMKRWMLSIEDACEQILRVVGLEAGTYILDMGEMFTVADMLERFLESKGSNDYPLKFVGAKPGEKATERLFWDAEKATKLSIGNRQILKVTSSPSFNYHMALAACRTFDDEATLKCLRKLFGDMK